MSGALFAKAMSIFLLGRWQLTLKVTDKAESLALKCWECCCLPIIMGNEQVEVLPIFQLGRWHLNLKPISGAFCFLFFVDKVMYSHDINCFIVLFLFRQITLILKSFTAKTSCKTPLLARICCLLMRLVTCRESHLSPINQDWALTQDRAMNLL